MSRRALASVATLAAGAVLIVSGNARAQDVPSRRTVAGRVLVGGADERPVGGQFVVLHRIGSDSAGAVDSARTTRDGRYRFTYRHSGGDAIYIVSTRYAGIAYFTPPLRDSAVSGGVVPPLHSIRPSPASLTRGAMSSAEARTARTVPASPTPLAERIGAPPGEPETRNTPSPA